jgi:hypothetical protein
VWTSGCCLMDGVFGGCDSPRFPWWVLSSFLEWFADLPAQALVPPSTVRLAPVMYEDSGPATKDTRAATSSTVP